MEERSGGRAYSHVITKISRMDRLPHFLRYGATLLEVGGGGQGLTTELFRTVDLLQAQDITIIKNLRPG